MGPNRLLKNIPSVKAAKNKLKKFSPRFADEQRESSILAQFLNCRSLDKSSTKLLVNLAESGLHLALALFPTQFS